MSLRVSVCSYASGVSPFATLGGLVQAGFPTPDGRGFEPWSLGPNAGIDRINSEWNALGREPKIGEVVWFNTTQKGEKEAERLVMERS
jgi:hypothetical protein